MIVVLGAAILSVVVAVFLGRVVLGGILRVTFRRARVLVRRFRDRRAARRAESDRRARERRQSA